MSDSSVSQICPTSCATSYGVASVSRIDKIISLLCKRALQKRRYSAKETYYLSILLTVSTPNLMSNSNRRWFDEQLICVSDLSCELPIFIAEVSCSSNIQCASDMSNELLIKCQCVSDMSCELLIFIAEVSCSSNIKCASDVFCESLIKCQCVDEQLICVSDLSCELLIFIAEVSCSSNFNTKTCPSNIKCVSDMSYESLITCQCVSHMSCELLVFIAEVSCSSNINVRQICPVSTRHIWHIDLLLIKCQYVDLLLIKCQYDVLLIAWQGVSDMSCELLIFIAEARVWQGGENA